MVCYTFFSSFSLSVMRISRVAIVLFMFDNCFSKELKDLSLLSIESNFLIIASFVDMLLILPSSDGDCPKS